MSFVDGFFGNVPSKLPIKTLIKDSVPLDILYGSSIVGTVEDKDDKSITIKKLSVDTQGILSIVSEHANTLGVKSMIHKDSNKLIVRTSPETLGFMEIGMKITLGNLYICLVQRGTNGIVFLMSDSITTTISTSVDETFSPYRGSKIRTALENREPYTPKTKQVVDKLIYEENDKPDLDYQEVDPKLLELIEQLIQAINRIADALERIEEKLDKSTKF